MDTESSEKAAPPVFGSRIAGVDCPGRPGAYAIIQDESGHVAVVESGGDWHLPGGGVEPGETAEQTLVRECREECGFAVEVLDFIGRAVQYCTSRQGEPSAKICDCFRARLLSAGDCNAARSGERLLWVTVDEALLRLAHEAHAWALRRAAGR